MLEYMLKYTTCILNLHGEFILCVNERFYKFPPFIRCAAAAFSYPPPPTALTEHSRDLKFGTIGPQGKSFGLTGAIFATSTLG